MDITKNAMEKLSAQERAVLYLYDAFNELLDCLQSEYVFSKVDVAFSSEKGLVIYSYNNGFEINQYLIHEDELPQFVYSPGMENPRNERLLANASSDDINKIFRKWESEESEDYPRTMLSKLEALGWFDENTKAYCVAIGYKDGVQNKKVIQYLFSELIHDLSAHITRESMELLFEIKPQINASTIIREATIRILADRFYNDNRDNRGQELYETMSMLSSAPYEKSQNRGRIGIATSLTGKSKAFVKFESAIDISKKNVRIIRKLLELSDRKNTILIAEKGKIIGVYSTNGKYAGSGILFRGYGKWELFSDKVGPVIAFDSVTVKLANQSIDQRIKEGFKLAGIAKYNEARIHSIVKYARKQSHGTTIVVSEIAVSESTRLAAANRAIRINPIVVDEKTMLSLSAIDGAMIINPQGVCYAIGAILDGVSNKPGNIARGARYNSAITYVDYEYEMGKKTVVIIVSSDDTVDIYPDNSFDRKQLRSN